MKYTRLTIGIKQKQITRICTGYVSIDLKKYILIVIIQRNRINLHIIMCIFFSTDGHNISTGTDRQRYYPAGIALRYATTQDPHIGPLSTENLQQHHVQVENETTFEKEYDDRRSQNTTGSQDEPEIIEEPGGKDTRMRILHWLKKCNWSHGVTENYLPNVPTG